MLDGSDVRSRQERKEVEAPGQAAEAARRLQDENLVRSVGPLLLALRYQLDATEVCLLQKVAGWPCKGVDGSKICRRCGPPAASSARDPSCEIAPGSVSDRPVRH